MASRPLYNGSARLIAGNGSGGVLRNAFVFRVSTAALDGSEAVSNASFEVEAGQTITLNWEIKKTGGGIQQDTPDNAFIRVFDDDDDQNARVGAVASSPDLLAGASLPQSGTFDFTPSSSGTYRIQLEMQQGDGNFGGTSDDWRAITDGLLQSGGLSSVDTAEQQDKGRIRTGHQIGAVDVTERGSPPPATFAYTGTEAVRVETTQSASQNKTTSREVYRHRHRRNGTSTVDSDNVSAAQSATLHRSQVLVGLRDFGTFVYDVELAVTSSSALHDGNTPQYTGLGAQAASGNWVHLVDDGTFFVDFETAAALATHTVDPTGTIENVFVKTSSDYSEDVDGVPQGSEDSLFIATAENMTAKSGRVLNARSEPLAGIFISSTVRHEDTGSVRDGWGEDAVSFATLANGWQDDSRVVTVATPPAGVHSVQAEAYFPAGTLGASPDFFAERVEQGSPSSVDTGKDWIAPASFLVAVVVCDPVVTAGQEVPFSVHVWERDIEADADFTPTVRVFRERAGLEAAPFAEPVLTKRPGTTGIYDGSFTSAALADEGDPEAYEVAAFVTLRGFPKTFSTVLGAVSVNAHDRYVFDGAGFVGFPSK